MGRRARTRAVTVPGCAPVPVVNPVRGHRINGRLPGRQRADVRVALLALFEDAVGDALGDFLTEGVRADQAGVGAVRQIAAFAEDARHVRVVGEPEHAARDAVVGQARFRR